MCVIAASCISCGAAIDASGLELTSYPFTLDFKLGTAVGGGGAKPQVRLLAETEQERDAWVRAINHNVKLLDPYNRGKQ